MNRAVVVAVVATALVATVVTALVTWLWGLLAGAVVGIAGGRWAARRQAIGIGVLTSQVRQWGRAGRPRSVRLHGHDDVRELGVALNAVGARIDDHISALEADLPWRRELVDALPAAAVLFGADGYLVAANDEARRMLGIPMGNEPTTMLAALGSANLAAAVRDARASDGLVVVDTELAGRLVRAHVTVVGDQRLVLVTDRTRERRIENLRRNFVVNASHELKTPAAAIQGLVEALRVTARNDPDRMPTLVDRLDEQAQRLVRIVHDLLDLRRLEDTGEPSHELVDVVPIVADALGEVAARAERDEVSIELDAPHRVEVFCDPDDLQLVVRNVVSNAIQYNRPGGSLTVRLVAGDPAVIEVADTGIGIPKSDLARIFERFYRVDVARSRETGGTGLGLSLVRHAVVRNGGTIEVDSLVGIGTTFRLRLPATAPPQVLADETPA